MSTRFDEFAEASFELQLVGHLSRVPDGPHLYAYVKGNPISYVDPTGENRIKILKQIIEKCKDVRCEVKYEPKKNHYFYKLGWCEHWRLTCYTKGRKGSNLDFQGAESGAVLAAEAREVARGRGESRRTSKASSGVRR